MYSAETTDEELEAIKDELAQADMLCLGGDSFVDTRLLVRSSLGLIVGRSLLLSVLPPLMLSKDALSCPYSELRSQRQGHLCERSGLRWGRRGRCY